MATACTNGLDTGFVDLGYMKVAALGVVQGITELLPISSTAHMRIVPALLGWKDPGSAFSAAMQLAALKLRSPDPISDRLHKSPPGPASRAIRACRACGYGTAPARRPLARRGKWRR